LHLGVRYDAEHHKNKWDDDVVIDKCSKTGHKKSKKELQEDASAKELINSRTHCTKSQNPSTSGRKHRRL
jgi:hypothetical protein